MITIYLSISQIIYPFTDSVLMESGEEIGTSIYVPVLQYQKFKTYRVFSIMSGAKFVKASNFAKLFKM